MDFAALPPEVNSGRMYAGPGSGSLLAAATAWEQLAAELYTTAANYGSVVSTLTSGPWLGASSVSMAAATSPYVTWLNATAAQAEQTGAQAKAAAAAHAAAFSMTVPPPAIVANRTQLASLVATNFFGQNAPAIAATEAQYGQMWAQDASAMYGYAAAAQAASQMTPFSTPPQTANPGGLATQSAATGQVAGAAAGQAAVSQVLQALPSALSSSAGAGTLAADGFTLPPIFTTLSTLGAAPVSVFMLTAIIVAFIPEYLVAGADLPSPFGLSDATPASIAAGVPLGLTPTLAPAGLTSAATASLGNATSMSGLSVPQAWATAAPEMRLAAAELPAVSAVSAGGTGMFGGMPLLGGAPLMGLPPRGTAASNAKDDKVEEAKRKAAKGRRSTMW